MRAFGRAVFALFVAAAFAACSDDSAGSKATVDSAPDGTTTIAESVSSESAEVFSFTEHDLCEWMSTDDLAEFISAEFDWAGTVEVRKPQIEPGENCEWVLRGETYDPLGSLYAVESVAGAYSGLVEYGEQADLGAWVVGHPALDQPALTAMGGFGGVAYGFPDDGRIITMWLDVPGHEPDANFFMAEAAVANQILHELGWFATGSG